MERKLLLQLIALFLITQVLGLFVAYNLISAIAAGEMPQPGIISDNPNDPLNAVVLIAQILVFTGVLLIAMRFLKKRVSIFLKIFESFVVLITSLVVFSLVFGTIVPGIAFPGWTFGDAFGTAAAMLLVIARIALHKNIFLRNVSSVLATSAVGALIGVIFGLVPVLIFIIALAAYDYIAVFKTKHMVALAKGIQGKNLAFTIAMPTKEHTFELGTGDLVVPLAFATTKL